MTEEKAALYARVSTENQELEEQIKQLESWAEKEGYKYDLYSEKVSSIKERPKYEEILENLDKYDLLVVKHLDRFGRTTRQILSDIEHLSDQGVSLYTLDQPIDTRKESMWGDLMTQLLSVFAELERKMIRRRMKEGYDKAHEEGRVGRPSKLSDEDKEKLAAMYESGRYTWEGLKQEFNVSKGTISKALKERNVLE